MMVEWDTAITTMVTVKRELAHAGSGRYPLTLPRPPATDAEVAMAEAACGFTLDAGYRTFLQLANGWDGLYSQVKLFGTDDLLGSAAMTAAQQALAVLAATGILAASGVRYQELLPIAASTRTIDLFALLLPNTSTPGAVIWFANDEIERYPDFTTFFAAMIEANGDILTLLDFTHRHSDLFEGVR